MDQAAQAHLRGSTPLEDSPSDSKSKSASIAYPCMLSDSICSGGYDFLPQDDRIDVVQAEFESTYSGYGELGPYYQLSPTWRGNDTIEQGFWPDATAGTCSQGVRNGTSTESQFHCACCGATAKYIFRNLQTHNIKHRQQRNESLASLHCSASYPHRDAATKGQHICTLSSLLTVQSLLQCRHGHRLFWPQPRCKLYPRF